jgi:hypothetical protein
VFVHHDSNAWIFVCLEFECLKNEFERNFKKEKEILFFPSPSLSFLSPAQLQPATIPGQQAFFFFFTARADRPKLAQLRSPAGPARLPPLLFCAGR